MWFTLRIFGALTDHHPRTQHGVYFVGVELYTRQASKSSSAATVAFALLLFDLAQLG